MTGDTAPGDVSDLADDDDALLERLVAAALEQRAAGREVDTTALCGARPDLANTLRRMLALAERLDDAPDTVADPLLGRLLGERYLLTARLGAGGMGMVYAARDRLLRREVAVKVLDDLFAADEQRVERFRREATSLAALDDPHIVAVHDFELASRPPYLVMDRVVGFDLAVFVRTLRERVADTSTPTSADVRAVAAACSGTEENALGDVFSKPWPQLVALMAQQMARALDAAHAVGVVHRDVKPSNFMADAAGRVRLLDFGLARRALDASLTRSDTRLGTPLYMAPEQVRGSEATSASDLYSLGATLYELCCLRPPFTGHGRELEARILHDEPTPPQRLRPRLPRDLGAIATKALHKTPSRRYASAAAMAEDLDRFLRFEPVVAQTRILPAPLRASVGWFRRYRQPALWAAVAVAVVGIVVGTWAARAGADRARRDRAAIEARQAEVSGLHARLSPYLGFGGSRDDRLRDPERARQLADLDRILDLTPEDDVARFLRLWVRGEEQPVPRSVEADRRELETRLGEARLQRLHRVAMAVQERNRTDRVAGRDEMLAASAELDREAAPLDDLAQRLRLTVTLQLAELDPDQRQVHAGAILDLARRGEAAHGRTALTCFARAVAAQLLQSWPEARDALLACDELCPDQPATLYSLARVHRLLSQPNRARTFIERAMRRTPNPHVNYLEQYAWILLATHDDAAVEAVLRRFPDDPDSRARAAFVRLRMGLRQGALEAAGAREAGLAAARAALAELRAADLSPRLSTRQATQIERHERDLLALGADDPAVRAAVFRDLLSDPLTGRVDDPLDPRLLTPLAELLQKAGDPNGDLLAAIAAALERLEEDGVRLR
ncbi:MAG: serine/threonine-protein kinase [Planctomycetota bacterium]